MEDKTSTTVGNLLQTNPGLAVVAIAVWTSMDKASDALNRVADALYEISRVYTGSGL